VGAILEDHSSLSPRKLGRRLQALAADALPCLGVVAYEANPEDGLTTALWVDSRGRRDVRDLVRVVETEPGGSASVAWSRLGAPGRGTVVLLLRVAIERPALCAFDVRFDISQHRQDPARGGLSLLLAAERFALAFDERPDPASGLVWIPAPAVRDALGEAVAQSSAPRG
jgi:hypothetical protein